MTPTSYVSHTCGVPPVDGVEIRVVPVGDNDKGAMAAASRHVPLAPVSIKQRKLMGGGTAKPAFCSAVARGALTQMRTARIGPSGTIWRVKWGMQAGDHETQNSPAPQLGFFSPKTARACTSR